MKKLNNLGFAHWVVPAVIVVLVGLGGIYFIVAGHAQTQTFANPDVSRYGCKGSPSTLPFLEEGSKNTDCVKLAKYYLDNNGVPTYLVINGQFGATMLKDVKSFQKGQGLEVDGGIGECTWYALIDGGEPVSLHCAK